jgi:opacity protein-like surface antigen
MKLHLKRISYLLLGCFALSSSLFAADKWDRKDHANDGYPNGVSKHDEKYTHRAHHHPVPKHGYKGEGGFKEEIGYKGPRYKDEARYKGQEVFAHSPGHFEILGGPGISQLSAGNSPLGITSSETDQIVQTNANSWNTLAAQLGVGYVHYFGDAQQYSDQVQWFPSIEPELNVYYLSSHSINGNVLRFNSAAFNDLTFDIPIRSTRLMLDAALTVASWKQLSVYVLGGIGNAWTRVGYSDAVKGGLPCPEQRISLNNKTNSNFAWEAGAGMTFAFNNRFALSIEYLYAGLGNVKTAGSGNTGLSAPVIVPARFNLKSGAGLLALHIAL